MTLAALLAAAAARSLAWLRGLHADPTCVAVAVLGLGALLIGLRAACRPPERVEERREVVEEVRQLEEEHRQEETATVRHVETREERRPDGAVTIVRVEDERTEAAATVERERQADARAELREVKVTERARPSWRVSAQAGWSITRPSIRPELYGAEVSRRIVGPLWLGVWGRADRTAGVSLAMEW